MFKKISIGVVGVAVLGITYYGVSPLFIHTRIDEVIPQSPEVTSLPDTAAIATPKDAPALLVQDVDPKIKDAAAQVVGTTGHPGSGTARVIKAKNGDVVRYENFKTINGPDLYVYLTKDLDAKEYVNLGALKATEGNINYEVPKGTNVQEYRYVMVWCKQFGVLFNYADFLKIQ